MKQRLFSMVACVLLIGGNAESQLLENFSPPPANCCLAYTARSLADQLQDWNQLGRYHHANEELKKTGDPTGLFSSAILLPIFGISANTLMTTSVPD